MNRIQQLFKSKSSGILSVYFTAGYPKLDNTVEIAMSLENAGVDMIEIGIPFSDPIADGPVIQASNTVAISNGMTVPFLLRQLKELRKHVKIPVILMGYLNPVMQYGIEKFMKDASLAGADGVILPDLPFNEYLSEYKKYFEENNLLHSFLISPTTSERRIREIDEVSKGFIYAVSASSTTGTKEGFNEDQVQYFEKLRELKLKNPFLIGFGIADHKTFSSACGYGAGAIVGSAFIRTLKDSNDLSLDIRNFVMSLKKG